MVNRPILQILHGQKLLTMLPTGTVQQACQQMRAQRYGAVVVTDQSKRLIGIFTGRDAVRCLAASQDPAATELGAAMTPAPRFLGPEATAVEALRMMHAGGFRHVPVLRSGVVIGIVSREDLLGMERHILESELAPDNQG